MWWRRSLGLAIVLFVAQSCGFQPLYGEQSAADSQWLATIEVETPDNRDGQLLKSALEDAFNPKGWRAAPQYRLVVQTRTKFHPFAINLDGSVSRYTIQFTSNYELIRGVDKKVVDKGVLSRTAGYNVADTDDYATFMARQDAQERVVKALAELYRLKMRSYFDRFATDYEQAAQ